MPSHSILGRRVRDFLDAVTHLRWPVGATGVPDADATPDDSSDSLSMGESVNAVPETPDARPVMGGAVKRRSLDSLKTTFLGDPARPQALQDTILQRLRTRKRVDREIEIAQVPDSTFVTARTERLRANPDADYLTHLYGIRTTKRRIDIDEQRGLRQLNIDSAFYQRGSARGGFSLLCNNLVRKKLPNFNFDQARIAYAHSLSAIKLMREQLPFQIGEAQKKLEHSDLPEEDRKNLEKKRDSLTNILLSAETPTNIAPGLLALHCQDSDAKLEAEGLLELIGGLPSNYQVVKCLRSKQSISADAVPLIRLNDVHQDIDNGTLLRDIAANIRARSDTLRLPATHPAGPAIRAVQSLVDGLASTLGDSLDTGAPKHSTLLHESLQTLRSLTDVMPMMAGEPERLASIYQATLDEIFLLLAATRPYRAEDFDQAATHVLRTRIGSDLLLDMDVAEPEAFLVSGGMEAITAGIRAARVASRSTGIASLSDQPRNLIPDYFEVKNGLLPESDDPNNRIFTAIQNPSTPRLTQNGDGGWDIQTLAETLRTRALSDEVDATDPIVVVLDSTIEKAAGADGHSDLRHLVQSLRDPIGSGALRLILCKSYQKYPSLSSGQTMAGSVVVLSKDDPWLESVQESLRDHRDGVGWIGNDESQLLIHFLQHGHKSELEFVSHAARNAQFVGQFCFPGRKDGEVGFDLYQPELPLALLSNIDIELSAEITGANRQPVADFSGLMEALVEGRNSFGFLETTGGAFNFEGVPSLRLSFGHEGREELVERFYGVGQLWASKLGGKGSAAEDDKRLPIDQATIRKAMEKIAADAADEVLMRAELGGWADQAVRILDSRATDRNDPKRRKAVKTLQDKMNGLASGHISFDIDDEAAHPQRIEDVAIGQLRKNLKRLWAASAPNEPERKLTDDLIIVSAALTPQLPDALRADDDIDAMRVNLPALGTRGLEHPSDATRYAPHMIVSLLDMAGRVCGSEVEAMRLYNAVLASGMRGVSPAGRTRTVMAWAVLAHANAKPGDMTRSPEGKPAPLVAATISHANFISYPEDKARLFGQLRTFSELAPEDQDAITRALFMPSNLDARPGILASLAISDENAAKVASCLRIALAEHRAGIRKNQAERVVGASPGDRDGLASVGPEEVEIYRQNLLRALVPTNDWEGFGRRMRAWAPTICEGMETAEATGQTLTKLAKLAEDIHSGRTKRWPRPDDDWQEDRPPLAQIDDLLAEFQEPLLSLGGFMRGLCEEKLLRVG